MKVLYKCRLCGQIIEIEDDGIGKFMNNCISDGSIDEKKYISDTTIRSAIGNSEPFKGRIITHFCFKDIKGIADIVGVKF